MQGRGTPGSPTTALAALNATAGTLVGERLLMSSSIGGVRQVPSRMPVLLACLDVDEVLLPVVVEV